MSLEKVKEYFKAYGIEDRIIELSESSATVELAAHALHTEPCRIAKTLSFMLGDSPILVVTAGNVRLTTPSTATHSVQRQKCLPQIRQQSLSVTLSAEYALLL